MPTVPNTGKGNMSELTYIIESLRPLAIPIDSCHPDPANARKGHAVDRIAGSLAQYKQRKPIVVNASEGNKIEAGNGTWLAAKSLGWSHIAAVIVEDDPMTAVGYGIADNRLGHLSEWDIETLATLLDSIDDDLPTGFEGDELEELLAELGAGLDAGNWSDAFGGLPNDDRAPFQQMTFTLHDSQAEQVKAALKAAGALGAYDSPNENSNGNALARICETFLTDYGNS
jgi:hypothetical protein